MIDTVSPDLMQYRVFHIADEVFIQTKIYLESKQDFIPKF